MRPTISEHRAHQGVIINTKNTGVILSAQHREMVKHPGKCWLVLSPSVIFI